MRSYKIKRGHFRHIEGERLLELVKESFGNADRKDDKIFSSFGALENLNVWTDGKYIFVDTTMNTTVDEETAISTRRRFYDFLEKATGFTAKQRAKKAQKEAKGK
jgi:hypothetical protein